MRAFFFWEKRAGGLTLDHKCNPYAGLLARELEKLGIHLELGDYAFEKEWLETHRSSYDVLHLNWLHWFYRQDTLEETVARYARFSENLAYAKSLGYRIVWTIHNRYPHERPYPQVDHLARLMVGKAADAVIAHCNHAADLARRLFYREHELHVIPHGNFIDVFDNRISRSDARDQLGIAQNAFVYLFFGNARIYKGLENLIASFSRVARPDANLVLMTRRAFDATYSDKVIELAKGDPRILVFTNPFFPNDDFQIYLNASDVVTLPFSEVLTSGTAITALGFGKPVILPALGCLSELIDEEAGILFDASNPHGLGTAMEEIRRWDLEQAGDAALACARVLDWSGIAKKISELYRGIQPV
ncbi:MAG: hypothetical protein CME25_01090 [Gemmatimonadetes bacterium]|nr:hypothetical protein [Gemmatimonadota bacterium]|tara:strand:- start:2377 stop:3456 length:1080 start_codon:yes stop_codon:yes gene_type:complete